MLKQAKFCDLPTIKLDHALSDSCKYRAIDITLTHIAQIDVYLFFKNENKRIIKDQINKKNLPKRVLASALYTMLRTNDISPILRSELKLFINEFDIQDEIVQNEKLIELLLNKKTQYRQFY